MAPQTDFWNSFYGDGAISFERLHNPTDFAIYVQKKGWTKNRIVVDIGCGSGRDSRFFAKQNTTVAIDSSETALRLFHHDAPSLLKSIKLDVIDPKDQITFSKEISDLRKDSKLNFLFYNRFFLHALTSEERKSYLDFQVEQMWKDDIFVSEHRVEHVALYEFGNHFRNPLSNNQLNDSFDTEFFEVQLDIEAYDLAKFGKENPKIGRYAVRRR